MNGLGVNPKAVVAEALAKPQLDLLEPTADEWTAAALADGAQKYGRHNYREVPVAYRDYLAAMKRHINALLRHEDIAPDSLIHHLGHIGANVHIIAGAAEAGTLVDDR